MYDLVAQLLLSIHEPATRTGGQAALQASTHHGLFDLEGCNVVLAFLKLPPTVRHLLINKYTASQLPTAPCMRSIGIPNIWEISLQLMSGLLYGYALT